MVRNIDHVGKIGVVNITMSEALSVPAYAVCWSDRALTNYAREHALVSQLPISQRPSG